MKSDCVFVPLGAGPSVTRRDTRRLYLPDADSRMLLQGIMTLHGVLRRYGEAGMTQTLVSPSS